MPWLQLRINTQREDASAIEAAMQANGALSVTLEDNADEPIFEPELGEMPLWTETRVTGLFEADINTECVLERIRIASRALETKGGCWQILEDKDWQREWMQYFKPIQCSEKFWICPSWTATPDPRAINLMLDPGLAFGTGSHPTTFLCLQWIAKISLHGKSAIDYGCGSGILGIAALLHGAESVVGIDIDPQALLATQENVKRNGLDIDKLPVLFPSKCPAGAVDVVFANILAGPLVDLADILIALLKPGGKICLSGILSAQKPAIFAAYSKDITIESAEELDGWVCVCGTKKSHSAHIVSER